MYINIPTGIISLHLLSHRHTPIIIIALSC